MSDTTHRQILRGALAAAAALAVLQAGVGSLLGASRGFLEEVYRTPGLEGEPARVAVVADVVEERLRADPGLDRRFSVRWTADWYVLRSGTYRISGGADDRLEVAVDGATVLERGPEAGFATTSAPVTMPRGTHRLEVRFEQLRGDYFVDVGWAEAGGEVRPFEEALVFPPGTGFSPGTEAALTLWRRTVPWLWLVVLLFVGWSFALDQRRAGWPVIERLSDGLGRLGAALAASSRAAHEEHELREEQEERQEVQEEQEQRPWGGSGSSPSSRPVEQSQRHVRAVIVLLVGVVVLYAAVLRLDAALGKYDLVEGVWPGQEAQLRLRMGASDVRPGGLDTTLVAEGYGRGDPVNYIRFAREMESFWAAHIREPMFVFSTKVFTGLLGGKDVGVSYASAFYSVLLVLATYLLGAHAFSRWVGLAAALAVAVERQFVGWGVDGWRDDAFSFFMVITAWAVLRLRHRPTRGNAVLAGTLAAGACLTRITALSFVVPAFAWALLPLAGPDLSKTGSGSRGQGSAGKRDRRGLRLRGVPGRGDADERTARGHRRGGLLRPWARGRVAVVLLAVLVATALVSPYLINCWIVYGDPLWSINHATRFYRGREGVESRSHMDVGEYLGSMARESPVEFTDTLVNGLTTYPFDNKWSGFRPWSTALADALPVLSLLGLGLFLWSWPGRFLLLMGFTSLVPYAFTWRIPGGASWRFTMHVYPLLLIAAFWAVHEACRFGGTMLRESESPGTFARGPFFRRAAATLALAGGLALLLSELPHLRLREDLEQGTTAHFRAGEDDVRYFVQGWHPPVAGRNVTARWTDGPRGTMRLPMLAGRDHRLILRLSPAPGGSAEPEAGGSGETSPGDEPQVVTVSLNGVQLARLDLEWDSSRVGSYEVDVPGEIVRDSNRLELVGSRVVRTGPDPEAPLVPPNRRVAFMIWYVNVVPTETADTG